MRNKNRGQACIGSISAEYAAPPFESKLRGGKPLRLSVGNRHGNPLRSLQAVVDKVGDVSLNGNRKRLQGCCFAVLGNVFR